MLRSPNLQSPSLYSPCRLTQVSCIAMVALGLLPWGLLVGALALHAIDSSVPVTMSVVVWLVLLVPMWVAWFGSVAWRKRHETAIPAVVMAAPIVVITALFFMLPSGVAAS